MKIYGLLKNCILSVVTILISSMILSGANVQALASDTEDVKAEPAKVVTIPAKDITTPSVKISPSTEVKPLLGGTFIQYWLCSDWDLERWAQEYEMLKDIGINEVILQYTFNSKDKYTLYPTKLPGYTCNDVDMISNALTAADSSGMNIRIGLAYNSDWWNKGSSDIDWLNIEAEANKAAAEEIIKLYGHHQSISGWYIPYEFSQFTAPTPETQTNFNNFLKEITTGIKSKSDKDIMISPFYISILPWFNSLTTWTNTLQTILKDTSINIVALQDSIGVGFNTTSHLADLYSYTKKATDFLGIKLYADTETFTVTSSGNIPADIDRIKTQLSIEKSYVEGFLAFSINHYQNKYSSDESPVKSYNDYQLYYLENK